MSETNSLLLELQAAEGCSYLSDLHTNEYRLSGAVKLRILEIPLERYSLREWNEAVSYITGKRYFYLTPEDVLKTKSSFRTMPLLPEVEKLLLAEKDKQEMYRKLFKKSYCTDYLDYICVDQTGKLLHPNYVTMHFTWVINKYNMKKIRFHDLRHPYVKSATKKFKKHKEFSENFLSKSPCAYLLSL